MKRLVSIVLMLSMIFTMFTTASAKSIAEGTTFVPNPMDLRLTVSVGSRVSGEEADYTYPPTSTTVDVELFEKADIDYRAKLNMAPVRDLFEEESITIFIPNDAEARAEFEAGTVVTSVSVCVEYPEAAIIKEGIDIEASDVGVLDAGSIFTETGRVKSGNMLTITYENRALTVAELQANVSSYLKDITFTLDDAFSYMQEGNHIVKVTLSGESVVTFATKTQIVNYSGTASNVVNLEKTVVPHELEVIPVVHATCFETGMSEGIICRTHNSYTCGALGTKVPVTIPKLNHMSNGVSQKIQIDGEVATCTKKGILEHWTCTLCKSDFDDIDGVAGDVVYAHDRYVLQTLPHNNNTVLPAVEETCITVGKTAGTACDVCGKITQSQTIVPALGHNIVSIPAIAPTCTVAGKTAGSECGRCHTVLTSPLDVPATGHKFSDWTITRQATEAASGLMERTCSVCGTSETREIEKIPHTCVADESLAVIVTEPTCTMAGTKQNYCECGEPVGAPVAVPAKGHNTERVSGTAATCVAEGVTEHYTCVVCDGKFRDAEATNSLNTVKTPIDKNNHGAGNYVTIKGFASTCIKQGLKDGQKCKNCNVVTVKQELLPLSAHTPQDVAAKAATCEENGVVEHKHCEVCNKDFAMDGTTEWTTRDFDIPALGHEYGEAVIFPEGQTPVDGHYDGVKRCTRDGCTVYIPVKFAVNENNCTHSTTLDSVTVEPTCTSAGQAQKVCLLCGKDDFETVHLPLAAHTLVRVEAVPASCHSTGTSAYYICSVCGKMFDAADTTREITQVPVLDKLEHDFRVIGGGNNLQCRECNEIVHVKKKNKDGAEVETEDIKVYNTNNVGIQKEKDKIKEDSHSDIGDPVTIESEIVITDREEVSETIDNHIEASGGTQENSSILDKAAWDIEINKITRYVSGEEDREIIKEIDDLLEIVFKIPASLSTAVDFKVHRLHINESGTEEIHEIGTTPDPVTGEYIVIDRAAGTVTLKVKKFSEYVLVGYTTPVNPTPTPPSGGGGGAATYTVQFKANGGTVVENVKVTSGKKITAPVTTREGYVFDGWYTDAAFTEKFDFDKPITRNITLYAKWTLSYANCEGIAAVGCESLGYNDVDTSLWYHHGVDYVTGHGMMIGVAEKMFAPNANITRGMLVTVLGRIEGVKDTVGSIDSVFDDVLSDEYYATHINWAAENNIVYGYSEDVFGPEDFITREQIAAIIHRYAQFKGFDVSVGENTNILSYDDFNSISEYAIPSVQYAVGSGLMKGRSDTTFNPVEYSTRAEIATILYRFLESNK